MGRLLRRSRRRTTVNATARTASPDSTKTVCPVCSREDTYVAYGAWLRDQLVCQRCHGGSVPRERAMALALQMYIPDWRELRVLECSPAPRAISWVIGKECRQYTPMNYFPAEPLGRVVGGVRNETLEDLSFPDESFDAFLALDVMEHIPHPEMAVREISRVLTDQGTAILTFPIRKGQTVPVQPRAQMRPDGSVEHLTEPEWHGDPFSDAGSLVFTDFGYDVHVWLGQMSDRNVHVIRFADQTNGILGEYTDVCVLGQRIQPLGVE